MARIFVSHSSKDEEIKSFFLRAFAGTNVKPIFEELEEKPLTGVNTQKIKTDILMANAVFVLLSENVENLKNTRDWIGWECGIAENKPIWIFEPSNSLHKVSVVVPRFNDYVMYDMNDTWREYIRTLISSYDDSHILPLLSAATGGGAILNDKDRGTGAVIGFLAGIGGLIVNSVMKKPLGIGVHCTKCFAVYKIHRFGEFRCAVCNAQLYLTQQQVEALTGA